VVSTCIADGVGASVSDPLESSDLGPVFSWCQKFRGRRGASCHFPRDERRHCPARSGHRLWISYDWRLLSSPLPTTTMAPQLSDAIGYQLPPIPVRFSPTRLVSWDSLPATGLVETARSPPLCRQRRRQEGRPLSRLWSVFFFFFSLLSLTKAISERRKIPL
jgi:hypothetical protein